MASATSLPESSAEYRVRLANSADTDALVRLINTAFIVEKPIIGQAGCEFADLRVVNVRAELQPIYERLGYSVTGIAPIPDTILLKVPSHFTVMSKTLK